MIRRHSGRAVADPAANVRSHIVVEGVVYQIVQNVISARLQGIGRVAQGGHGLGQQVKHTVVLVKTWRDVVQRRLKAVDKGVEGLKIIQKIGDPLQGIGQAVGRVDRPGQVGIQHDPRFDHCVGWHRIGGHRNCLGGGSCRGRVSRAFDRHAFVHSVRSPSRGQGTGASFLVREKVHSTRFAGLARRLGPTSSRPREAAKASSAINPHNLNKINSIDRKSGLCAAKSWCDFCRAKYCFRVTR